jgi:hypothetical protein
MALSTKYTKTDLSKIGSKEHRENAAKLADFLENDIPVGANHDNYNWVIGLKENLCGTSACALGWAALSNRFPGLQLGMSSPLTKEKTAVKSANSSGYRLKIMDNWERVPHSVLVNGKVSSWEIAGTSFFGEQVYGKVFCVSGLSTELVVAKLRSFARSGRIR